MVALPLSNTAVPAAETATVYEVALFSSLATSSELTASPLFTRLTTPASDQTDAIQDAILHYANIQEFGWTDVAILSTTDQYGVSLSTNFINSAEARGINVVVYRQFVSDLGQFPPELQEIKNSGVRVIVAFVFEEWEPLIIEAGKIGLVDENHVWFVSDLVTATSFQTQEARQMGRGIIAAFQHLPQTQQQQEFVQRWMSLDPVAYPTAGAMFPPIPYTLIHYDLFIHTAMALDRADRLGLLESHERIPGEVWKNLIRNITFAGASGEILIDEFGDRIAPFALLYYSPETDSWLPTAVAYKEGYEVVADVVWFSNTTVIPDLDIRPPFGYWSCHDKEKGRDETGKQITLHTPDRSDVDDIGSSYYCDEFIDCQNLSDEGDGCKTNIIVFYIIMGIITGLLILFAFVLLIFVIIFGIILKYRRLRVASPPFLTLLLATLIVGFSSVFAWFGKPHPVACAFQPWLLGLPTISMIIILSAKTFRIYRIFKYPMKKQKISNIHLCIIWLIFMIPAIAIVTLWMIISTPTADMRERADKDHYVCTTGGFTGEPGGYIFFGIFVAYGTFVLCIGAVLCVLARKVPAEFNESKLLAVSIYNLALLSVVIIPVYIVLLYYEPFIASIVRTCAILYAYSATMFLQFIPKLVGVIFFDRCLNKNANAFVTDMSSELKH